MEADVVVVGAGIVGVATAYNLARAGKRVVVVDKGAIGGEASGRNGGHLAPTIDGAWAPLGQLALDIWPQLIADIDGPTEYRRGGGLYVVVAHDPMEPADILAYRHARASWPSSCQRRNADAVCRRSGTKSKAASCHPAMRQVNPILTTKSLAHTAARHFGVEFLLHSPVTSVCVTDDAVMGSASRRPRSRRRRLCSPRARGPDSWLRPQEWRVRSGRDGSRSCCLKRWRHGPTWSGPAMAYTRVSR